MFSDTPGQIDRSARAVADPSRRRILERLADQPGATTGELAALNPGLTRFATIKHLDVLRRAGLVRTMSEGRRRRHYAEMTALGPLREWLRSR